MGRCELESGDVALPAIPIRKMTIGIAQTLLLIIDWRIAMKRTTGDQPELKPVNVGAIDVGSRMHMAAVNPACTDVATIVYQRLIFRTARPSRIA
jgi:hypothetical protein